MIFQWFLNDLIMIFYDILCEAKTNRKKNISKTNMYKKWVYYSNNTWCVSVYLYTYITGNPAVFAKKPKELSWSFRNMEGKAIKSQQHPSNAPHSWRMISRGHNHHIHSGTRTFDPCETHRTETTQLTQEAGEVGQGVQGFLGWLPGGGEKKTGHWKLRPVNEVERCWQSGHVDGVDELIEMDYFLFTHG